MQITYAGHHIEVTPALRTYAQEKMSKLQHHVDNITAIHVVLSLEKLKQVAEATVSVSKAEVHARAEAEDMYAAIDGLLDKLDRQLIKYKEKRNNHHNHREQDAQDRDE